MFAMRWIADLVYVLLGLLYLPYAVYEALVRRKNRTGWRQRFGAIGPFDPGRPRIWIHAVSLGEINATPRMVSELERELPGWHIVISNK